MRRSLGHQAASCRRHQGRDASRAFLDYSMSRHRRPRPARRARRPQAGAPPHPVRHARAAATTPPHPYRKSADTRRRGAGLVTIPTATPRSTTPWCAWRRTSSLRYPLVDGQGNFGSVDGDPPAAYRYTEARMSKIAVRDDDRHRRRRPSTLGPTSTSPNRNPRVLPSRFPNLLVNGAEGIAVGMATNIPPHNLREVVDGIICPHRRPRRRPARPDGARQGPRLPHRRHHHGPHRHPCRLRHRPRQDHPAGPRRDRGEEKRPLRDHRHRDPLYGQQGPPHRVHCRSTSRTRGSRASAT